MRIIGEKIIALLKSDSTLVSLLGSATNIIAKGLNEFENRYTKCVTVECFPGEDLNYASGQEDSFDIEVIVSRGIENSFSTLMNIVERVDDLINKSEQTLSTSGWKIIHISRDSSPTNGALIDDKYNEYFFQIRYSYILDESS